MMNIDNPIATVMDRQGDADRSSAGVSAVSRTFDHLRQRIISLQLPPDTVLSRTELAKQYDVSQTPVREAMQRLEAEGLVRIYPQSRTIVTRIDADQIHEAHFLRVAVEAEILRHLALDCPVTVLNRLKTIIMMQEALAENPDEITSFQELDEVFHQTLMAGAGQAGLHAVLRAQSGHLNRVRRLDLPGEGKIKRIVEDHKVIVAALEARNPDAAVAAIRQHLSQTVSRVDELKAKYPDFFKSG